MCAFFSRIMLFVIPFSFQVLTKYSAWPLGRMPKMRFAATSSLSWAAALRFE
jgi:hypothetical protein